MPKHKLVSPTGKPIELARALPNAGIRALYEKHLNALIAKMVADVDATIVRVYRTSEAEMALDATPANELRAAIDAMRARWLKRFETGAKELARWFAKSNLSRSDAALDATLKKAGFTVPFRMTDSMRNAYDGVIGEQVGLIRSIGAQHLTNVETLVMQSVQQGRALGELSKKLNETYGVTKRRAALIARDQNNKATATLNRQRRIELGITHARWRHSAAGKTPRPSHVEANGKIYEVAKGMYLDGVWTWPGHEINCRCSDQPIIPGFDA